MILYHTNIWLYIIFHCSCYFYLYIKNGDWKAINTSYLAQFSENQKMNILLKISLRAFCFSLDYGNNRLQAIN